MRYHDVMMRTALLALPYHRIRWGRTKFTTSGAHDVIAITSPQKNDLCTEELREFAKSLDSGHGQSNT